MTAIDALFPGMTGVEEMAVPARTGAAPDAGDAHAGEATEFFASALAAALGLIPVATREPRVTPAELPVSEGDPFAGGEEGEVASEVAAPDRAAGPAGPRGAAIGDPGRETGTIAGPRGARGPIATTASEEGLPLADADPARAGATPAYGSAPADDRSSHATAPVEAGATASSSPVPRERGAAGSAVDPALHRTDRDLDDLAPEFRSKLERVIERMRTEFGHEVRVVEGVRSQERQDFLYQQGRTRPGPVVTWTRSSAHTAGVAADLIIDDSFDHPVGFARLAQVARAEGLTTLGARDPGHVELREAATGALAARSGSTGTASADRRRAEHPSPQGATAAGPVAPVAPVSRVAATAAVARVAPIAPVARTSAPGRPVTTPPARDPGTPARAPEATAEVAGRVRVAEAGAAIAATGGAIAATGHAAADPAAPARRGTEREPTMVLGRLDTQADARDADRGAHDVDGVFSVSSAAGPTPTALASDTRIGAQVAAGGAEAAERVARALELRESGPQAMSHVMLRLDDVDGGDGRVRIGLRGTAVDATVSVSDPAMAARMERRVDELARALERRGLEPESLLVRSHAATDVSDLQRVAGAAADRDATRSWIARLAGEVGTGPGRRDHDQPGDPRHRESPPNHDRSRREPKREDRS